MDGVERVVVGDIATGTEVLVIGGGPGGYTAAARAAKAGKEVTLVEMDHLGGVCLNRGCIPSKALISAAGLPHALQSAAERGITVTGLQVDFARMQAWKDKVVERLQKGVAAILKDADVQVVKGRALFQDARRITIDTGHGSQSYKFEQCIIATGSRPAAIPGFDFDGERILSSTEALNLTEIPGELAVIGGGYIGLELGMVYAKLGSRVTVLEALDQILPGADKDLVQVLQRSLRRLNIAVHTGARARGWQEQDGKAVITFAVGDKEQTLSADKVLVATGRRPNSDNLGLEQIGVATDAAGFITVDEQLRTSVAHIYAIGDVAGQPMLAHKASKEAHVVADVIAGRVAAMDAVAIPAVVFTDPEIAYAGLTEAQAREQGYEPVVGRFNFAASGRALTMDDTNGFIKVVADKAGGLLLGVQIAGPEASEMIAEAVLALEMGARAEDLALTVHPHPTLCEGMMEAAEAVLQRLEPVRVG